MSETYQLFKPLPKSIEDALRSSIQRFGVLVPVVKDQNGEIIDGHHRARIADELGVKYRVDEVAVADTAEARELARTLNADRRQLTEEQRREVVALLAGETVAVGAGGREEVARHSTTAIAGALGVSQSQVDRDVQQLTRAGKLNRPEKTLGLDGKMRPTRRQSTTPDSSSVSTRKRKPLPSAFRDVAFDLVKAVERVRRLVEDERYPRYAEQVARMSRHDLLRASDLLAQVIDRVPQLTQEDSP